MAILLKDLFLKMTGVCTESYGRRYALRAAAKKNAIDFTRTIGLCCPDVRIFHRFFHGGFFLYWNSQKNSLQSHHVPRAQIMVLSKPYCLQTQLSIFPGPAHSPFAFRTTLSSLVYTYSLDLDCQELHDHSASKNKSSGFFFSKISAGCIVDTQKVPQQML